MPNNKPYSGVTEYSVKQIGAYHMIGDDDYEPQRNKDRKSVV